MAPPVYFGSDPNYVPPDPPGQPSYPDTVLLPFDVGISRDVLIIDSISGQGASSLETYLIPDFNFGTYDPTGPIYDIVGDGTKDLVIDLEGLGNIQRGMIRISNFHRNKVIATDQQFRVQDHWNWPSVDGGPNWLIGDQPTSLYPFPAVNGHMGFRIAPCGEAMVWLEGTHQKYHDPDWNGGQGISMMADGMAWRGTYCTPGTSYYTSEVSIVNSKWHGAVGCDAPQRPETHSDIVCQNQGPSIDPLARFRRMQWDNAMFDSSMGGWTHQVGSLGVPVNDDKFYGRNFNVRLTAENRNIYHTGSGVAHGPQSFQQVTPANYFSQTDYQIVNGYHTRYSEWLFGWIGTWNAKHLHVYAGNQTASGSLVVKDPQLTWYDIPSAGNGWWWGGYEPVHESKLGANYVSHFSHNHRA